MEKPDFGNIRAVTFDAGGTLIDPWPSVGVVYAEVAREFGVHCSEERLTAQFIAGWNSRSGFRYTRAEWAEVVRQSFHGMAEVPNALFEAIYERFSEPRSWLIYDDVIPTLQKLEGTKMKLAVISNWDERLEPLLERLGLATYFDEIFISSLIGAHKPEEKIFRESADRLGIEPTQILHVGDSLREDVQGARSIGAAAVRIRRSGVEGVDDIARLTAIVEMLG